QHVLLNGAHHHQGDALHRTDPSCALAYRAGMGRAFDHTEADALAAHFHEAEVTDATHLDAGAIVLEAFLELSLHLPVGAILHHVDEVDHDKTGKVAQS